jgi:hypothetical protein
MYKGVKAVVPLADYQLLITFDSGERRVFDMKPYLGKGVFAALKDESLFNSVHVGFDTVEWDNGADLCPEVLYSRSRKFTGAGLRSTSGRAGHSGRPGRRTHRARSGQGHKRGATIRGS